MAINWQGLFAPFIVELFAFRHFGRNPHDVSMRFLGVATGKLPTPACVKRTSRAFHPNGHNGFGPNPAGGFQMFLGSFVTRFEHDRPWAFQHKACPARPHSLHNVHGIESGDYSSTEGLLPKASLELDEPFSRHPALRNMNLTDGKSRPLSRLVRSVCRAFMPISKTPENALALTDAEKSKTSPLSFPYNASRCFNRLKVGNGV